MLLDIAEAKRPLHALVEFALRQKGAMVASDAVDRYADMLSTAISADDGEDISSNSWGDFVTALDGASKFESAVFALGQTLNASEAEIRQFIAISDSVSNVLGGAEIEDVEAELDAVMDYEDAFNSNNPEPFGHLDDESKEFQQEKLMSQLEQTEDDYLSHSDLGDD